jgi:hypothetical protein
MGLKISIPQIDPLETGYTFVFGPGINLITGLNGSGKSRVAKGIFEKILIQNTVLLNTNLVLLEEFFKDITPEFLQDPEIFLGSHNQKIICDKANSIYKDIAKPNAFFEEIIFKDNCFKQERMGGAGERAILNLITLIAYRATKEKYQEIPIIIDGSFGILDKPYQDLAIRLIKIYTKYAILLTYPQSIGYLDFDDIASHYKIITKIHKDRFQHDFDGHAQLTETKSQAFFSRIELVQKYFN